MSQEKVQRRLNVFGAGDTQVDQTGFNRAYYEDNKYTEESHEYLVLGSSSGSTNDLVESFVQVVQYGTIGQEFPSEKELFQPGEYVQHVSCGRFHSLFVTNQRRVFCCGSNSNGSCALPDTIPFLNQVTLIPELSYCDIVETTCGGLHSFFISEGYESVFFAGFNTHGECGRSTWDDKIYSALRLDRVEGKKLKCVSPGAFHTVFVTVDNCVYSSGYCGFGSLGQGSNNRESRTPLGVDHPDLCGLKVIKKVQCGQWHSIVIAEDGSAYAWGHNGHGQCGLNSPYPTNVVSPTLVNGVPPDEKVVDARCGSYFTVFRTHSNNFYGCGENSHGALGLPTIDNQLIVTQIPLSIGTVLDFSCGVNFTVFSTKQGITYTCGSRVFVSSDQEHSMIQLEKDISSVSEVYVPWVSTNSFYNNELLIACPSTGNHALLYSVPKSHSTFSNKLFATQQKGLYSDTTVVTKM